MKTLEKLGIKVLPASKYVAQPFKIIDQRIDTVYYAAQIFEFRDQWLEFVCILYAHTEQELAKQLKDIYKCDYPYPLPKEKALDGFVNWWQNTVNGNYISNSQFDNLVEKFTK